MAGSWFYLVRHGETNALGVALSGRGGAGLNLAGSAQVERLASAFAGMAVAGIFSSPQVRTQHTAAPIASRLALPVQMEPALDEIDFGAWTGRSFSDLSTASDWMRWNSLRSMAPAPGTETMLQAQARAAALLPRLHASRPGGSFILVSHADIVKSILALTLGMPIDLMQRLAIAPASRSTIVLDDHGVRVENINLLA